MAVRQVKTTRAAVAELKSAWRRLCRATGVKPKLTRMVEKLAEILKKF